MDAEQRARYVERWARVLESQGETRIGGRIYAHLATADGPSLSLGELAQQLGVSRASVSTNTRRLVAQGMLTRVPQPTLLYGYGGYNLAQLPSFGHESAAWVQAGGVYALAHLRGGSEFGQEWWHGGRCESKQQTFDDRCAVAEHLLDLGLTRRERLAVEGESHGGLLTGAAVVQRPDLWRVVVSDVPLDDLLRFDRDPLTIAIGRVEYGDPSIPAEAEWLRAVSPVERVVSAAYPHVLVTAGANDPCCPVWHGRLLVDLLEQAQQGDAPVLLRVYEGQGHGRGRAGRPRRQERGLARLRGGRGRPRAQRLTRHASVTGGRP